MNRRPDAALEVALEQRERRLDEQRRVLAEREMILVQQAELLRSAEARVQVVLHQMDAAQAPLPGVPLAVAVLGDLERLLHWCEVQVQSQREQLEAARGVADEARGAVALAHQQVR